MDKNNKKDLLQLAVAAARAYYGDITSLAAQALKHGKEILAVAAVVLFVLCAAPAAFVKSLFTGYKGRDGAARDFAGAAVEALAYGGDWLKVLAAVQAIKLKSGKADMEEIAAAVRTGRAEEYIRGKCGEKPEGFIKAYKENLSAFEGMLGNYAGYRTVRKEKTEHFFWSGGIDGLKYDGRFRVLEAIVEKEDRKISCFYENVDKYELSEDKKSIRLEISYDKFVPTAFFPVHKFYGRNYSDDFGSLRVHDGKEEKHEGIDIFSERGAPVVAVEDCTVGKIGWDGLGGWRILLQSKDGKRKYYCAHLEEYSHFLKKYKDYSGKVYNNPGIEVEGGTIIGYVGSSGSFDSGSPPGADTGTPPHLHFQMWVKSGGWFSGKETLVNPYPVLRFLEEAEKMEH